MQIRQLLNVHSCGLVHPREPIHKETTQFVLWMPEGLPTVYTRSIFDSMAVLTVSGQHMAQ